MPTTARAKLLRQTALIIYDEATQGHKYYLNCMQTSFQDLCNAKDLLFGGIIFVAAGDFRQTLPIIRYATEIETITATLKYSTIWNNFEILKLTENLRVKFAKSNKIQAEHWAKYLINMGNGELEEDENYMITIPKSIL